MAEKDLQQTREERGKRTASQKALEWKKLEVIGSRPERATFAVLAAAG